MRKAILLMVLSTLSFSVMQLIVKLSGDGIQQVNYRDTEHYQITRRFLENPEGMMERLLRE